MWGTELGYKQMKKQFGYIFTAALALVVGNVYAVPTLEIMAGSGTSTTSTIAKQTTKYVFNKNNPADSLTETYFPEVKVSYEIVRQNYPPASGSDPENNGLFFANIAGTNDPSKSFIPLSGQGGPRNSDLSSSRFDIGEGVDVSVNYGTRFSLRTSKLSGKSYDTRTLNGGLGYAMGAIKLTWDRPVTNPVIHISGLGGGNAGVNSLGYAAQFELETTGQVDRMAKLSGVNFGVAGWKILNTSTDIGATAVNGGSTGSIQVYTNQPITTLTFGVYVRTDLTSGSFSSSSGDDAFVFSAASIDSMVGDPLVAKTNNTASVAAGGYTTYTVRATNVGGNTYTAMYLNDRIAQGLQFVKVECSTAAANKCTDSSTIDPAKLFVLSDADLTSTANSGQDTGPLAAGEFYEVLVTAKVTGNVGTTTLNKASVKLPTLGGWITTNQSCKAYSPTGGVNAGLTRLFDTNTGICSVTDTDTITKPVADLAVLKTAEKTEYKAGDLVKYTIQAWNEGPSEVKDAIVTDVVPASLASVWMATCKAYGTAVCPSMPNQPNGTNINTATSPEFTLPVTRKDANGNKQDYLEFTLTALAYQTGSVTNTASIASASVGTDANPANNTSSVTVTIKQDAPDTTGDPKNMCVNAQSVNLITDTVFYTYAANNVLTPKLYTLNSNVVPFSVAYGTGTNGALQLQGKINWSFGNPRITGSTIKIYVNGTPYAVLTTPGASTNNNATFTALNGATVTPENFIADKYNTEPQTVNFTLTFPTTVTAALNDLKIDFQNISPKNSASDAGDDIGFSLNSLNVCLKPTFELKKISTGGTDAFEFSNFSNLAANASYQILSGEVVTTVVGSAQNVRLKNSVSPVENGVTTPVYADANKTISFTEKASDLYSLRSVECIDSNSGNSGNVTGDLAVLQGNTVTLDASKVKFASKLVCKVTNEKKAGYVFSGRVFNDNSGTTGIATNAYNGTVNTGEVGIAGSRIELQNCSTKEVFASAQSNANGDFEIHTLQNVFDSASNNVCLVQKNVDGYTSVSAKSASVTATPDATHDLFSVTKNGTTSVYDGFLFGDAQLQLLLTQNGQKNISAGDVVDYPHEIISRSVNQLEVLTPSNTQQPSSGQSWQSIVYYDANCNGEVDAGEKQYSDALQNPPLSAPMLPGQKICLVQRVISPSTSKAGDSLTAQFNVQYTQNYAGSTAKTSNSVQDITTVGSAGLELKKRVRTVASCPATNADTEVFTTENTASKNQFLEYEIGYTNNSAKKLIDVVLKDAVPVGAEYKTCTENCTQAGGALAWNIPGVLLPGAKGTVHFCVKVQ